MGFADDDIVGGSLDLLSSVWVAALETQPSISPTKKVAFDAVDSASSIASGCKDGFGFGIGLGAIVTSSAVEERVRELSKEGSASESSKWNRMTRSSPTTMLTTLKTDFNHRM